MTSAERLCLVAARSEGLLADFVILFLIRWGLKYIGVDYVYVQDFWPWLPDRALPPLDLSSFQYPGSAIFHGSMYFVSGLPELILAGMWVVYATMALSIFGRTLGMRQAGLRLVDGKGRRPRVLQVIVRQLAALVSAIAWIGYWPAGFTPHAETLHDLISKTRVVYVEEQVD